MKKYFIAFALIFPTAVLFAQGDPDNEEVIDRAPVKIQIDTLGETAGPGDTTKFSLGKRQITVITKSSADPAEREVEVTKDSDQDQKYSLTWWNGIDIGVNGILNSDYGFDLEEGFEFLEPNLGASRYIGFNFAQLKGRLIGDYVGITTGMTVQFYNFKYNGDNSFVLGDSLYAVPSGDRNITKNKLRAAYFGVPLMLEFNTSEDPDRSFHITAGVIGKVRIGNMYKQKYSEDGNNAKAKEKGELGFNRFGADAVARVGYRNLTFFAQVGLLPLFDDNNAPDMQTFAAGLALTFN